jgi:hypothetical protein
MTLFEAIVVVFILSAVTTALAHELRLTRETHVQCWHCRTYTDVSEIHWSATKFNGHQVPLCRSCEPEAQAPASPSLAQVA